MFILREMDKVRMQKVSDLSDDLLEDLLDENDYSVAVMASLDCAVRIIKSVTGCDNVPAINTLISILSDIRKAEIVHVEKETN